MNNLAHKIMNADTVNARGGRFVAIDRTSPKEYAGLGKPLDLDRSAIADPTHCHTASICSVPLDPIGNPSPESHPHSNPPNQHHNPRHQLTDNPGEIS